MHPIEALLLWSSQFIASESIHYSLSPFVPVDLEFLASYWLMAGVCQLTYEVYVRGARCISLLGGVCQFSTLLEVYSS